MRDCLKPFLTHGWSLGEKRIEAAPPPPPQVSVQSALLMQRELLNILSYLVVVLPEVLEAEPDRLALSELERESLGDFETSGNSEMQAVFFIVFFGRWVGKSGRVRRRREVDLSIPASFNWNRVSLIERGHISGGPPSLLLSHISCGPQFQIFFPRKREAGSRAQPPLHFFTGKPNPC